MSFRAWSAGVVEGINIIIVPTLIGAAFIVFVWGVLKYFFLHGDSEESRRQGRQFMLWGIFGLVMIFVVWGLVYILLDIVGWTAS